MALTCVASVRVYALLTVLLASNSLALNYTFNRNYFNFPPLTDWIPVFSVGDTLNVSWSTYQFPDRNIVVWCGKSFYLIQTFTDLPEAGYQLIQVLDTWSDPCHLELYAGNYSSDNAFNSGAFNINPVKAATPTTWAADDANSACPTHFVGSPSTSSATTTTSATTPGSCTATSPSDTAHTKHQSGPGFGAGIGVGIAISAGIGAISALVWGLAARRRNKQRPAAGAAEFPMGQGYNQNPKGYAGPQYAHYQQVPVELHNENTTELPTRVD